MGLVNHLAGGTADYLVVAVGVAVDLPVSLTPLSGVAVQLGALHGLVMGLLVFGSLPSEPHLLVHIDRIVDVNLNRTVG